MAKILVVDDDPSLRKALSIGLQARGYALVATGNGEDGVVQAALSQPDVVVLDLGLPDVDGIEVCRRIRSFSGAPIIVLSASGEEQRKIQALDSGADDYVTKPFSMPELEARLRVALRHAEAQQPGRAEEAQRLVVGSLVIDLVHHEASHNGRSLELTAREFDLLAYLAKNAGKVCTHHLILQHVWGPQYQQETHYLRVYSHRLRRKLGDWDGTMLRTHPGIGYQLVAE
ncbi:MAG: response regulator transcription factor [Actinomycetota bacterium]|nr:response regulator transcription factor [Actinomycetota bacterium]